MADHGASSSIKIDSAIFHTIDGGDLGVLADRGCPASRSGSLRPAWDDRLIVRVAVGRDDVAATPRWRIGEGAFALKGGSSAQS